MTTIGTPTSLAERSAFGLFGDGGPVDWGGDPGRFPWHEATQRRRAKGYVTGAYIKYDSRQKGRPLTPVEQSKDEAEVFAEFHEDPWGLPDSVPPEQTRGEGEDWMVAGRWNFTNLKTEEWHWDHAE